MFKGKLQSTVGTSEDHLFYRKKYVYRETGEIENWELKHDADFQVHTEIKWGRILFSLILLVLITYGLFASGLIVVVKK